MTESIREQKRIEISVPQSYKLSHQATDQTVWEELEAYLFTGFLTARTVLHQKTFVFKTLNSYELKLIDYMKPGRSSAPEVKANFRSLFIAYSVFMVDGHNMFPDRARHITRLTKTISRLPSAEQDKILENLAALNERASRVFPLTEVYAHESRGRYKWMQLGGTQVHSALSTGIAGTDELGTNHCQQMWTAINRAIDKKEEIERDWANAKFIGSCFAGKAVRSIDERDKMRLEKERTERDDLKMKVLFNYLNRTTDGGSPPEMRKLPDGRMAEVVSNFRADSAEDLRDQLERALNNEKDHHDLVVEKKQRELAQRHREIGESQRQMFAVPIQPVIGDRIGGGDARVLGGKTAADAYLARMQELKRHQMERMRRPIGPPEGSNEGSKREGGG